MRSSCLLLSDFISIVIFLLGEDTVPRPKPVIDIIMVRFLYRLSVGGSAADSVVKSAKLTFFLERHGFPANEISLAIAIGQVPLKNKYA